MRPELRFLIILPLTILVEGGCGLVCKFVLLKKSLLPVTVPVMLITGAIATGLTLPYVWFVIPFFFRDRLVYLMVAEAFAVVIEGLLYWFILKVKPAIGLLLSFLLNLGSFAALFLADGWLLSLAAL
jgi:hypothetical protein